MAAIVANTGSNNWNTNGAWVGGVQPTAADDVTIPATAVVTIPTATTALCRSCTVSVSGTLAFAATTSILTIGDGTAGAGNVAFSNAGTITLTGAGTINFVSTAASSTQTLTSGGQALPNVTLTLGTTTTIQLADTFTIGVNSFSLNQGTFDTNSKTVTIGHFFSATVTTRSLILGSTNMTVGTANSSGIIFSNATNMTLSAGTSTVTVIAGASFQSGESVTGAGLAWNNVVLNPGLVSHVVVLGSTHTITNLSQTATAKTDGITFGTNVTITGTFTLTSASAVNRTLVQSSVIGTARTITAAAISFTNVDFQDITGAGLAGNAAWTGTSMGDALGNTNITFDTPATQTWSGTSGGNWSTNAWTSRVPLPQDDVVISSAFSASQTITADMPRLGKSINWTGATGSPTWNYGSISTAIFGNLTLIAGMTVSGIIPATWGGRGSFTVTSAGRPFTMGIIINAGNCILQDALVISRDGVSSTLQIGSIGGLDANGFNVTISGISFTQFSMNTTGTLNMGSGTWSFGVTTATTFWLLSGGTVNAQGSTIVLTGASANARTFAGGGKTYGTLTYTVANSPGSLTITGANTFNTINIGSGRILTMPASTTNTFTTFNASGANNGYVYLPGVVGQEATAPDSAALSITGDIDIRVRHAADDWTPTALARLIEKRSDATHISYELAINTAGTLNFTVTPDGSTLVSNNSTVATGFTDGTPHWLRVTRQSSTGSVVFYTAADSASMPSSWTQLGTTVAGTSGSIFDGTQSLEIGGVNAGSSNGGPGNYYRAQIRNNILDDGTGIVFDADFTAKAFGANTFVESSVNAATVTINGTLAQAGDGRVSLVSSSPGTQATINKAGSGLVTNVDYLSIQDSKATPSSTWYAGTHSILVSNDTGWNTNATVTNAEGFFHVL